MMSQPEAHPITSHQGAEITGVDLTQRLDDETIAFLRKTFDDTGLLLFRDVSIDRAYQVYLSEFLRGHEPPTEEQARVVALQLGNFMITNRDPDSAAPVGRLMYHCDGMWSDEPFEVLSLHALVMEPPVLPTLFVSATSAWKALPDELKQRIQSLNALHVPGPDYVHERRRGLYPGELVQAMRHRVPTFSQNVAWTHPRTGETILFVTQGMTREILELNWDGSEDLIEELFAVLYAPERVYAHDWREGDLILWDNLALQHARPYITMEGPARTLQKIGLPVPRNLESTRVDAYARVG
jgi:taurine dioxygenase